MSGQPPDCTAVDPEFPEGYFQPGMKLFIMTDLEGVAGVMNSRDWIYSSSKYYETAKRLLTEEVNAAVHGFLAGGFQEILVYDAHCDGAINVELLHPEARIMRGYDRGADGSKVYPFGIDKSFDALAFVGQHAKPGTPFSHLTHNMWWNYLDTTVNGVSVGEYGMMVLSAGELGVPVVFASGEKALCEEAAALCPWVITAAVKEGTIPGTGNDLDAQQWENYHQGVISLAPSKARQVIQQQAKLAAEQFSRNRVAFKPLALEKPYTVVTRYRDSKDGNGPARTVTASHPESVSQSMNAMFRL